MSIHKLTAGAGYDYLTRQVAALDSTEKGHTGLASYYTERGETPGVWIGSGMGGIDGLTAGDPVTADQMRALFGCSLHPLAELRQQQLEGPALTIRDFQEVTRLGAPFKIVDSDVSPFRLEVAKRFGAIQAAAGLPAGAPLSAADRARVRTEVARGFSWLSMAGSPLMLPTRPDPLPGRRFPHAPAAPKTPAIFSCGGGAEPGARRSVWMSHAD